jgi:hypothetical protein
LPYLGLYTLVILKADELCRLQLITPSYLLSILQGANFVLPPTLHPMLRIRLATSMSCMPLPMDPTILLGGFHYQIFIPSSLWRIPVRFEVILSMFLQRVSHITVTDSDEIRSAQIICSTILLHKMKTGAPDVAISRSEVIRSEFHNKLGIVRQITR